MEQTIGLQQIHINNYRITANKQYCIFNTNKGEFPIHKERLTKELRNIKQQYLPNQETTVKEILSTVVNKVVTCFIGTTSNDSYYLSFKEPESWNNNRCEYFE